MIFILSDTPECAAVCASRYGIKLDDWAFAEDNDYREGDIIWKYGDYFASPYLPFVMQAIRGRHLKVYNKNQ